MVDRSGRQNAIETVMEARMAASLDPRGAGATRARPSMMTAFPLLLIPVMVYNLMALISMVSGQDAGHYTLFSSIWFHMPMPTGAEWDISYGDVILFGGMVCLFFELLKSTSSDNVAIFNHTLSLLLFVVCLVEFLLLKAFATSTFFFLMIMTLMDVVAGFIVTAVSARKDIGFE